MAIKAREMATEKMKKHASFLGIQPYNELGLPKEDRHLRAEYMMYAKRNPQLFKETVDSELVDIQYAIKMAIVDSKIDVGRQPGTAFWANSMGMICKLPTNKNVLEALTELAFMPTPEGKDFKEKLKSLMT